MHIKIRITNIWLKIFLYVIVFLWFHSLYLIPYRGMLTKIDGMEAYRYLLGFVATTLFLICYTLYGKYIIKEYNGITIYFIIYIISYVLLFGYSYLIYDKQSLVSMLHLGAPFLIPLLVIPLLVIFKNPKDYNKFMLFISILSTLWCVILVLQTFSFQVTGSFLFDFKNYFTTGVTFRNDNLRLSMGSVANMMVVYNFYQLYYKRHNIPLRIYYWISMIVELWCVIVVQQTRMYEIAIFLSIVLLIMVGGSSWRTKITRIFLLIVGLAIIFSSNIVINFIQSFSIGSDLGVSTSIRFAEVNYYIQSFLNNPLFGNGLTSEELYFSIEHGPLGVAYYVDVGIIGLFAQTGLLAIVFYVIPFCRMLRTTIYSIKYTKTWQWDAALLTYLFITMWSLLQFHPVQVMAHVITFSYYEYRWHYLCRSRAERAVCMDIEGQLQRKMVNS